MTAGESLPETMFVAASPTLADPRFTNTKEGLKHLDELLTMTGADVLIIDPWRLWLGGDENDAQAVVDGLKRLSELRRRHPGLTIIIVHHTRKEDPESPLKLLADPRLWTDSVSGHHALTAHTHAVVGLERRTDDEGVETIVFGGVGRSFEPKTIILTQNDETLLFDVARNHESAEKVMTKAERELWEFAKQRGRFRHRDLVPKARSKKTISTMLKKALQQGALGKDGHWYVVVEDGG